MSASRFLPLNLSIKLSECLRLLPIIPKELLDAQPVRVREIDGIYVITFLLNNGVMFQDLALSKTLLTRGMYATKEDTQLCFHAINDALDYMDKIRNEIKREKEFGNG